MDKEGCEMQKITREYNYSDVYLVPRKTIVGSRKECDTSVKFGNRKFDMPVIPANMKSVVKEETCEFLSSNNWFYVMHRFGIDSVKFIDRMQKQNYIASISLGVNEDTYEQLKAIKEAKLVPEYATVDIANSWCPKAERMIKFVKDNFPKTFLIAGNMATGEAVQEIESWGADAVKVFVGPGLACTTRVKTGFTRPTISCLMECVKVAKTPVIADGGVKEHGDIAKALACGASMVMVGSLFSGWNQSGSEIIEDENGHKRAVYFGSASEFNKNGKRVNVEGRRVFIDYKGDMNDLIVEMKEDLQSSISYAGGKKLNALRQVKIVSIN